MVNKKADRARQFLPFDALKGYKEAIKEKQKVIIEKKQLSEDDANILSYKLNQVKKGMMIKVIFYNGENYEVLEGMVAKIDYDQKILTIVKRKITIDSIISLESKEIVDYSIE